MTMSTLREFRTAYCVLIATVVLQGVLYRHLPDPMPVHWNADGVIDGRLAKPLGPWLGTLILVGATVVMTLMPRLSPANFPMLPFARVYRHLATTFALFALWVMLVTDAIAMGWPLSLPRHLLIAVGLLYVVLGNWMGKLTQNFYCGIRTPWTIANAEVWNRTHRLAGPLIMLAGIASLAGASFSARVGFILLAAGTVVGFALPAMYSWWISPPAAAEPPQEDD